MSSKDQKRCPNCIRPIPKIDAVVSDSDAWYCASCDDVIFIQKRELVEQMEKESEE